MDTQELIKAATDLFNRPKLMGFYEPPEIPIPVVEIFWRGLLVHPSYTAQGFVDFVQILADRVIAASPADHPTWFVAIGLFHSYLIKLFEAFLRAAYPSGVHVAALVRPYVAFPDEKEVYVQSEPNSSVLSPAEQIHAGIKLN